MLEEETKKDYKISLSTFLEKKEKISPELKNKLEGFDFFQTLTPLEEKFNFPFVAGLGTVIQWILMGGDKVDELPNYLEDRFNLEKEVARNLAKEVITRISPVFYQELFGLKEKPKETKIKALVEKIFPPPPPMDIEKLAEEIKKRLGLTFDEILEKRFKNMLLAYFQRKYSEIGLKEFLMRPVKIGGLELEEGKAMEILRILKEQKEIRLPLELKEILTFKRTTEEKIQSSDSFQKKLSSGLLGSQKHFKDFTPLEIKSLANELEGLKKEINSLSEIEKEEAEKILKAIDELKGAIESKDLSLPEKIVINERLNILKRKFKKKI